MPLPCNYGKILRILVCPTSHPKLLLCPDNVLFFQASGLALFLVRHTYDTRLTTTAEAVVVRDFDGIRVLSAGKLAFSDEDESRACDKASVGSEGNEPAVSEGGGVREGGTKTKVKSSALKAAALRRQRHARREQARDTTTPKQKIEAAAAAMRENLNKETSALHITFLACDKKYVTFDPLVI